MSFEDDIKRATAKIRASHDATVRGTTIALFNAVIMDTPVLDGRLRGDWQTSVGQPASSENGRVDTVGSATNAEVTANTPPGAGQETYLTNNMPYAYKIEYEGWSKIKAPQGMVRRNVDRFQRLIDEQARKNKV
ncbi:hypothetical protein ACIGJK_03650 [Pseudomonas iridis]|uniref:hypothetical protein n=1 Tax=Pseudomonas iridis TaxID=2710587 RepID=UPI0037C99302